jgi:hypothetical protein
LFSYVFSFFVCCSVEITTGKTSRLLPKHSSSTVQKSVCLSMARSLRHTEPQTLTR